MKFKELQRYSPLYTASRRAGADVILNSSFGLNLNQVVPLGISHGVDFDMCPTAMEVNSADPIHWAYNESIFQRAIKVKPSIHLPHPWWFVVKGQQVPEGDRVLVIGPPPGRINDERLLKLVQKFCDTSNVDILLKKRGGTDGSTEFWQRNGIGVVTAGQQDANFYLRLFQILSSYSLILCCTFSSAAIFAASIGKKIQFLKGYHYRFYDVPNYLDVQDFNSLRAKDLVIKFIEESKDNVTEMARDLLGFSEESIASMKERYLDKVSEIRVATFNNSVASPFLRELALLTGRPGIASMSLTSFYNRIFAPRQIAEVELDELSAWIEGLSPDNFKMHLVPYVKNKTEPGRAVDIYESDLLSKC